MTAPDATYDCVDEANDESFKIETLLKEVKQKIGTKSSFGLRGIGRIFRQIDSNGSGFLDVDDFRWGLFDFGIVINQDEAYLLLKAFDNGKEQVSYDEFVRTI